MDSSQKYNFLNHPVSREPCGKHSIPGGVPVRKGKAAGWRSFFLSVLILGLVLAAGCGTQTDNPDAEVNTAEPITQTRVKGPVEITVSAAQPEISLADTVDCTVTAVYERGYDIRLIEEVLLSSQEFIVRNVRDDSTASPDTVTLRKTYTLEPHFSGEMTIPELTVLFSSTEDTETKYTLKTEPITITVAGLTEEQKKDLAIRPIMPPRQLPARSTAPYWLTGLGLLILFAGGVYLYKRYSGREQAVMTVPAHIRALEALQALGKKRYIEAGQYETFYYELTWIMRVFIAERFAINAPESTTEEFLETIRDHEAFPDAFKPKFEEYMEHADLVKYAQFTPSAEDIQRVFDVTREFIVAAQETGSENGLQTRKQ